ncbi:1103_t:CDS:2 [Paraglomus brasilianum]|uniref:1103_t:CDS:1 n=1 Tax=Paraglomus brasilianum TaxID=144538 RepID=A0A9N9FU71_9GLOM|nr:1103_t:CDS:2 [Paraglomus brasilianum]
MSASLPPLPEELKFLNPYLQRATELDKREPVIAYYCRYYAAQRAIANGTKTPESNAFLNKLLDLLEAEKKSLAGNEALTNDIAGSAYVENFALKIFINADNEDRLGKASRKTAKTFLAAAIFLEILETFGNVEPETKEKIKYAKWKAGDIAKAIRDGRVPTPGPPSGEKPAFADLGDGLNASSDIAAQPASYATQDADKFSSAPLTGTTASLGAADSAAQPQTWASFPTPPGLHDNHQRPQGTAFSSNSSLNFQISDFPRQPAPQDPQSQQEDPRVQQQHPQVPPPLPPKIADFPMFPTAHNMDQLNQQPPTSQRTLDQSKPNSAYIPCPFYATTSATTTISQHQHQHYQQPQSPTTSGPPQNPVEIDPLVIAEAQKHTKWAASAMNYNDIKAALNNLQKAQALIEQYNK